MASFSKRCYGSWRLSASSDASLNATFGTLVLAEARLREPTDQDVKALKVNWYPSLGWQARVRRKGMPDLTKTCTRRDVAEPWANAKEGEIVKRQFFEYLEAVRNTLGDLLPKYDTTRLNAKPKDDPGRSRVAEHHVLPGPGCVNRLATLCPEDRLRKARCRAFA